MKNLIAIFALFAALLLAGCWESKVEHPLCWGETITKMDSLYPLEWMGYLDLLNDSATKYYNSPDTSVIAPIWNRFPKPKIECPYGHEIKPGIFSIIGADGYSQGTGGYELGFKADEKTTLIYAGDTLRLTFAIDFQLYTNSYPNKPFYEFNQQILLREENSGVILDKNGEWRFYYRTSSMSGGVETRAAIPGYMASADSTIKTIITAEIIPD